jgi:hypothetical protein
MRATLTMRRNDDFTLTGAAHALRTIEGVETVTVDEDRSAVIVDYDSASIDDGELLNRVSAEGIVGVELLSLEDR